MERKKKVVIHTHQRQQKQIMSQTVRRKKQHLNLWSIEHVWFFVKEGEINDDIQVDGRVYIIQNDLSFSIVMKYT